MNELALHIGYHKTATTFLQRNVFDKSDSINYLGIPWINDSIGEYFREFKFTHDIDFNSDDFKKRFNDLRQSHILKKNAKPDLVSLESLHSGTEWFGLQVESMANRLSSVFAPSKIILGIRNQQDYINSNYKEYIIHGGKLNFKYFLYKSFAFEGCLKPKLEYDKIIKLYNKKFGSENVFVYLQEQLKNDRNLVLSKMSDFLSVDYLHNSEETRYKGMSKVSSEIIRLLNRVLAKDFIEQYYYVGKPKNWSFKEKGRRNSIRVIRKLDEILISNRLSSSYLDDSDKEYINSLFSINNRELNNLIDVDIRNYGYQF